MFNRLAKCLRCQSGLDEPPTSGLVDGQRDSKRAVCSECRCWRARWPVGCLAAWLLGCALAAASAASGRCRADTACLATAPARSLSSRSLAQ
jgi:hypothetical protein